MRLGIHAAFRAPNQAARAPFFYPQAASRAARLEIGRIDHDGLVFCDFRPSQAFHHLENDALDDGLVAAEVKA